MCRATRCKKCGKTTWAGCGQHIATVEAAVPNDQWCAGHAVDKKHPNDTWLSRILGR